MTIVSPSPAADWAEYLGDVELPVLRRSAEALDAFRAEGAKADARTIGAALAHDPFISMRVFAHLARIRPRQGAEISTLERAIMMVGIPPFLAAFSGVECVEQRLSEQRSALAGLLAILRRARRASRFALQFARWRNDAGAEEIMLAAQLHDFAEMLVWCFAPELALRMRDAQNSAPGVRSRVAQRAALGIELAELQMTLVQRWHLPGLLVAMMDDAHADNPRVRNVMLAVRLARHSARNWNNPALPDDYRDVAALLSTTPQQVMALTLGGYSGSLSGGAVRV